MALANYKSKSIEDFLTEFTGKDRVSTIKKDTCVSCGQPAVLFNDDLSLKEYSISGMCQVCQDSIFG